MFLTNVFAAAVGLFFSPPDVFDATEGASNCRVGHIIFQQGSCSACLAFASSAALGYRMCLNENQDFMPSPFRMFDCLAEDCEHGLTITSVEGVRMLGIGDINATPPIFGWGCEFKQDTAISDWVGYFAYGEASMKTDIYLFGPAVADIFVDPLFHMYRGLPDVFQMEHISRIPLKTINSLHAVVIVGWGTDPEPHWVIQNSWGVDWGRYGRAKIPITALTSHHSWRSDRYFWSDLTLLCGWMTAMAVLSTVFIHSMSCVGKCFGLDLFT